MHGANLQHTAFLLHWPNWQSSCFCRALSVRDLSGECLFLPHRICEVAIWQKQAEFRSLSFHTAHPDIALMSACRPVSDPFGYLMGAGPPVETKESKRAWGDLVKGLRVRGPASKSDPSLAAGLMRMTGAGGEYFILLARQAACCRRQLSTEICSQGYSRCYHGMRL